MKFKDTVMLVYKNQQLEYSVLVIKDKVIKDMLYEFNF
jgi:hypothetical protein